MSRVLAVAHDHSHTAPARQPGAADVLQVLGESPAISAVRAQIARLSRSAPSAGRRPPPILILGETGTGKGLVASAIHAAGGRAGGPFVDVNCAAIPETLLEAELFGFERGAFTDARHAKPGLFQAAQGGTIFLDEIGLMPVTLQAKLLKVIEERSVRRLGATRGEPLDVAVVAATSEDLATAARSGRFRLDLYHRLSVVTLVLPPLRDRGRDVLLLARHFLGRACEDYGLPPRMLHPDAEAALMVHAWPGNVRELANVLERAALLSDEDGLDAAALGLPAGDSAMLHAEAGANDDGAQAERERAVLLEALEACAWNFTRASERLGLPRNTLRYRIERLGLAPEAPRERPRGGRPPGPARRSAAEYAAASPTSPTAESPKPVEHEEPTSRAERVTFLEVRLAAPPRHTWEASRALEASAAKATAFGGHIDELGTDRLRVAFGLEPDEEAPRRAAYAALAVRRLALGADGRDVELPVAKLALHTEAVGVSHGSGGVRLDDHARARACLVLQELLDAAPPGSVVASASTGRFVARRFELVPVAAVDGPCRVIRPAEVGRTPFVGRERELRLLGECFEMARAGHGQVVMIAGEAGVGKSRLLGELRRRLGRSATWIEGQALSFGRSAPLHPIVAMLRRVFRIEDGDPEAVVVDKIEAGVQRVGPDLDETLPFLRHLLSVDPGAPALLAMDPRQRQDAIVRATSLLLARGAELRPHVIALEDLHWCDPATEDWLTRLADTVSSRRVLVLLTYRPGYRPAFPASVHTALALSSLSGEDTLRIARSLMGEADLPPALAATVADKAEGNPFFVEELVRSFIETTPAAPEVHGAGEGADHLAVPDTIEDVIRSRIHRLDEPLKRVLEAAAVIGRTVPFALLHALVGGTREALSDHLCRLEAAGFLREARAFPDVEHVFEHALTQDVAYARVAPDRRRALHARVAEALGDRHPDRHAEDVERLAYHASRGELWPAAVRHARQAGVKALDRSANREAVASFEQALAALAQLPGDPQWKAEAIDIRLELRGALLQLGEVEQIRRHLREAEALATALGDRRRLAWVWAYTTITHLFAGEPAEALAVGARALALAEEIGDPALRASVQMPLAHACREGGDCRPAVALLREAIGGLSAKAAQERLGHAIPRSFYARSVAAFCLAELGQFSEAIALGTEAADQTESLDLPFGLAMARMALAHGAIAEGRSEDASRLAGQALDLIEMRGLPTWFPWAAALRGYALALSGRPHEGAQLIERAVDRGVALGFLMGHSERLAWLGHAHLLAGRPDAARSRAVEALDRSRRHGERGYQAWALYVMGEIESRGGDDVRASAAARYREAATLAGALGAAPLAARCQEALGRLASPEATRARPA